MPRFFSSASSSCWLDAKIARESSDGMRPTRITPAARNTFGMATKAPAAATDPTNSFRRVMFMFFSCDSVGLFDHCRWFVMGAFASRSVSLRCLDRLPSNEIPAALAFQRLLDQACPFRRRNAVGDRISLDADPLEERPQLADTFAEVRAKDAAQCGVAVGAVAYCPPHHDRQRERT